MNNDQLKEVLKTDECPIESFNKLKERLGDTRNFNVTKAKAEADRALDELQFDGIDEDFEEGKTIVDDIMKTEVSGTETLEELRATLRSTEAEVASIQARLKKMLKGSEIPKDVKANIKKDATAVIEPFAKSIREIRRTITQLEKVEGVKKKKPKRLK